jgi:protein TonB
MIAKLDAGAASEVPPSVHDDALDHAVDATAGGVTVSLFSSWPAPPPVAASRGRERFVVLALSVLLHAGLAAAAFRAGHAPRSAKRVTRVEVELARPPERPKPEVKPPVVPPPPPEPAKQKVATRPVDVAKPAVVAPVEPVDTGSSLPFAEDGELHAGSGGLGTAAPAPPPPPVAAPEPAPPPLAQAREGANYQNNPRPPYPRLAKREHWEGTTVLRILVQPSGKPGTVKVAHSSGHDVLDDAAAEAVTNWSFVPASQGGKAVEGFVMVPIVFRLQ